MYEDTPADLVSERLAAAVYKGSPLARPILGTQSTLAPMTGAWLDQWRREHYRPGVLVAALAGSFTDSQVDKLKDCLSALEPGVAPVQKPAAYRPAVTARKKAIEQNHLILAFPCRAYLDPSCTEFTDGMLTEAIAAVLKYTQYAVKGCPAAREKLHNAAALAGASYGNIVDEVTPRLPYFPTEQEVSINDNDLRCAELAERLGFDDCRAMFTACQAL